MTTTDRLTPKATAVEMRRALRTAFPGTKFSLTTARGTSYGYMDLHWRHDDPAGSPAVFDVEFVLAPFLSERLSDVPDDSTVHIRNGYTCKGIYMARTRPEDNT
jgi:hypothetical protein